MKIHLPISFVVGVAVLLLIALKCEEMPTHPNLANTEWKVSGIFFKDSTHAIIPENDLLFTFKDSAIQIQLDVNNCFGTYTSNEGTVKIISGLTCTEICCDSKLADLMVTILPKLDSYSVLNNQLSITGDGAAINLLAMDAGQQ